MAFVGRHFLFINENNALPFDRRVWREALALRDTGARISVICPVFGTDNKRSEVIESVAIYRYPTKFSNGTVLGYLREYITAFLWTFYLVHVIVWKRGRIDVIHVGNPPDIFWPLALYLRAYGVKLVFDEHDLSPETFLSRFEKDADQGGAVYKILRLFQKMNYLLAHAVIATNQSYQRHAIERCPRVSGKIFIVRNGPDIRKFTACQPQTALKKGKSILLAYIGIMAVQDGVDYIINAAHHLIRQEHFYDFIIYLIGTGDDVPRLQQMVVNLGLQDFVIFTGRIPDQPAIEILSTADICLSPDPCNPLNDSSTMNKVMEYMALSKPIVSFNLTEARFSAQGAAIYAENNDVAAFARGIMALVNDPAMARRMGKAGRQRIEMELSWEMQIPNLIQTYRYILLKKQGENHESPIPRPAGAVPLDQE